MLSTTFHTNYNGYIRGTLPADALLFVWDVAVVDGIVPEKTRNWIKNNANILDFFVAA